MKQQLNEIKRMQLLAGVITESEYRESVNEAVSISGDYNDMDFDGSEKNTSVKYLKTPNGMKAVSILKKLVSKKFDSDDLSNAIEKCNFEKTNYFRAAAKAAGLELEGLGTVDNKGNGDFEVENSNYTDKGAAVVFFNDEFERVG